MDWIGFGWDGDGYVDFKESMMTVAALRMMQLQRENLLLQQQFQELDDNDDSSLDIHYGWIFPTYNYSRASGSGIS